MSYTWKQFKDEVKSLLTTDGNRRGATTFVDLQLRAAVLDLQRYIPRYRQSHENTYAKANFTHDGKASRIALPDGEIREAYVTRYKWWTALAGTVVASSSSPYIAGTSTAFLTALAIGEYVVVDTNKVPEGIAKIQTVASNTILYTDVAIGDDLDAILYKVTWEKRPCSKRDWSNRYEMISNETCINDGYAYYSIDPAGSYLLVYPQILELDSNSWIDRFTIVWDGIKAEWADADATKFDQAAVSVVADYVKGECARHFTQDIQTWATFCRPPNPATRDLGGTYYTGRSRLYRDELRRT